MELLLKYLSEIGEYDRISPKEEIELAFKIKAGGVEAEKAAERFICANLKLVVYQAQKVIERNPSLDIVDLIQEGNMGLMIAIKKYDPTTGFRFSTYAIWWIRQSIQRYCEKFKTISIPVYKQTMVKQIKKEYEQLILNHTKEEALEKLSKFSGVSYEKLQSLFTLPTVKSSLDAPLKEDGDHCLLDRLVAEDSISAEEVCLNVEIKEEVRKLVEEIENPSHRKVVKLRFGIEDGEENSYQTIGEDIGVSRERVRQILTKQLRLMKPKLGK